MTITLLFPLAEGPHATYNLLTVLILWAAAMVNFITSPKDSLTEQRRIISQYRKEQDRDQQHKQHQCRISVYDRKWEEVTSLKYLGAALCRNGSCSAEVLIKIVSAMAVMARCNRLNRIWQCNTMSFASKFKLCKSLVTAILLYGCETWTLLADCVKKDPGFQNQVPEETSLHLLLRAQDQRLCAEQDQLSWRSTGTPSDNCREMEICMVQVCHTPQQPLQNHPSRHLGGWAMPWLARGNARWQHQRVNFPAYSRSAHKGLLQKSLEEDFCWIISCVPLMTRLVKELNWTECSLSFTHLYHFQRPWLYFKVTAMSNSFNWKFYVLIWLNWNVVQLLITSSRSCIYHYF